MEILHLHKSITSHNFPVALKSSIILPLKDSSDNQGVHFVRISSRLQPRDEFRMIMVCNNFFWYNL